MSASAGAAAAAAAGPDALVAVASASAEGADVATSALAGAVAAIDVKRHTYVLRAHKSCNLELQCGTLYPYAVLIL